MSEIGSGSWVSMQSVVKGGEGYGSEPVYHFGPPHLISPSILSQTKVQVGIDSVEALVL
jgi:hypothetical protein